MTLRHSSTLLTPPHAHMPFAFESTVIGNSVSDSHASERPTLPSFREAFPEHCSTGQSLQPGHWDGSQFQTRRGSPRPSSTYGGSQHSSPYTTSRSVTPESIYVYPPQPRASSPLPRLVEPLATLRVSGGPQTARVPSRAVPSPSAGHRGFQVSVPRSSIPSAPAPSSTAMPRLETPQVDDFRQVNDEHYHQKRRPVLRPVQRLPAGASSDWEQFVREARDENGEYQLQCIWEDDDSHACLYQAEKQAMKRHVEVTHMRIKPHKCPYCDKRFGQKTAMKVHRATHTGETPLECRFKCGRHFSDPARRFRHYTQDHNYVPRKRHNTNRKRAKLAKEARTAAVAVGSPLSE